MVSGTISAINYNSAWVIASSSYTPSDTPSGMINSILITIRALKNQNPTFQMIFNGIEIKVRLRWFGDWAEWKTITLT